MTGSRCILHADMDAFYAAVEQRDAPELRGRPVIVGGLGKRGVVATASYEARRHGVHSAMPTAIARRLCPDGVYLVPRMRAYVGVSRQVMAIFRQFTPEVEALSLDEAFLDVTESRRLFGDGPGIADRIRREVRAETGLTVSVGVASSKYVAKVASDLEKPDGLVVVKPGEEARFLAALPVARLWGAGRRTVARLESFGLRTIGDVQRRTADELAALVGDAGGHHFHALAHGLDPRAVVTGRAPKSVSHETTFADDLRGRDACRDVIRDLGEAVGRRLRRAELVGSTVKLKLRHPPFVTLTRQHRLPAPCDDDPSITSAALDLYDSANPEDRPVRLLGVGVTDLVAVDHGVQLDLFDPPDGRVDRIMATLDAIRDRFGESAIGTGRTERPHGT